MRTSLVALALVAHSHSAGADGPRLSLDILGAGAVVTAEASAPGCIALDLRDDPVAIALTLVAEAGIAGAQIGVTGGDIDDRTVTVAPQAIPLRAVVRPAARGEVLSLTPRAEPPSRLLVSRILVAIQVAPGPDGRIVLAAEAQDMAGGHAAAPQLTVMTRAPACPPG